jgi:hypothetical protein
VLISYLSKIRDVNRFTLGRTSHLITLWVHPGSECFNNCNSVLDCQEAVQSSRKQRTEHYRVPADLVEIDPEIGEELGVPGGSDIVDTSLGPHLGNDLRATQPVVE